MSSGKLTLIYVKKLSFEFKIELIHGPSMFRITKIKNAKT